MKSVMDKIAAQNKALIKEAFLPTAALGIGKALARVGKVVVKHPWKALTGAGIAAEVGSSAGQLSDTASGARNIYHNMARR